MGLKWQDIVAENFSNNYENNVPVDNSGVVLSIPSSSAEKSDQYLKNIAERKEGNKDQSVRSLELGVRVDGGDVRANQKWRHFTIQPGQVWTDETTGERLTIESIYHDPASLRYSLKFAEKPDYEKFGTGDNISKYGARDQIANIFLKYSHADGPDPMKVERYVGLSSSDKEQENVLPPLTENLDGIYTNTVPPEEKNEDIKELATEQTDSTENILKTIDNTLPESIEKPVERETSKILNDIKEGNESVNSIVLEQEGNTITLHVGDEYKSKINGIDSVIESIKKNIDGDIEIKFDNVATATKQSVEKWGECFIKYMKKVEPNESSGV